MSTPELVDAHGVRTPIAGELVLAVAHAFTPEADAVLARAADLRTTGKACRVVSVDSDAALAAWLEAAGVRVAVGSDPDGALARQVGRWDETTCAWRPGWVQLGQDGRVIAVGDEVLPPALRAFLDHRAAPTPAPPAPAATSAPPWGLIAVGLGIAAVAFAWWASRPGAEGPGPAVPGSPGASPPAPQVAAPGEAPAAAGEAGPGGQDPEKARKVEARAQVGGGWFAVPARQSGKKVRWSGDVLEIGGNEDGVSACLAPDVPLGAGLTVRGEWALDAVGDRQTKGARVTARLLDAKGHILPAGVVAGGPQLVVANGRGTEAWAPFEGVVPAEPAAALVRVCVDNRAGSGTVKVRGVVIQPR